MFFPEEVSEILRKKSVRESIVTIEEKANSKKTIAVNLIHLSGFIYEDNETQCTSLYQIYDHSQFSAIVAKIKQILIDILLELEKEFGNLDDMDIETGNKDKKELEKINHVLIQIVFKDDSIKIDSKNKLKNVNIRSKINEK